MLERINDSETDELNSELSKSEKARVALTTVFFISIATVAGGIMTIPNSTKELELVDSLRILANLIPLAIAGFSYFGRADSIYRSNEIIQEAQQQGLQVRGILIREVLPPVQAA